MVYEDASVTDVACAGLNGMRMGERTLTVRRATENAPGSQMGAQHTGMMPAAMNQPPPPPDMPASRIIRCPFDKHLLHAKHTGSITFVCNRDKVHLPTEVEASCYVPPWHNSLASFLSHLDPQSSSGSVNMTRLGAHMMQRAQLNSCASAHHIFGVLRGPQFALGVAVSWKR